jgi:hypothetical protein
MNDGTGRISNKRKVPTNPQDMSRRRLCMACAVSPGGIILGAWTGPERPCAACRKKVMLGSVVQMSWAVAIKRGAAVKGWKTT